MGLKYCMPDNYETLKACEGFYIDNIAFFGSDSPDEATWDEAIEDFIVKAKRFIPSLQPFNKWETEMGTNRLVLMRNHDMQIIMGDDDRYVSLFLVIPETCGNIIRAKKSFDGAFITLNNYLVRKYPGKVFKRKNTWNLEPITEIKEERGHGYMRRFAEG